MHQKILDLINEFDKVAGYKFNSQKFMAFLCTNNELSQRETKETIIFTVATNKNKVLRNKFNQGGKRPILRKLWATEERN